MSSEKKFCFVTFRSEEEAVKGLQVLLIHHTARPMKSIRPGRQRVESFISSEEEAVKGLQLPPTPPSPGRC
jgi:hypothetical protein